MYWKMNKNLFQIEIRCDFVFIREIIDSDARDFSY